MSSQRAVNRDAWCVRNEWPRNHAKDAKREPSIPSGVSRGRTKQPTLNIQRPTFNILRIQASGIEDDDENEDEIGTNSSVIPGGLGE